MRSFSIGKPEGRGSTLPGDDVRAMLALTLLLTSP
jgi:hypothetical protein